jgi:DNA polymerase-3 subunit epsilon
MLYFASAAASGGRLVGGLMDTVFDVAVVGSSESIYRVRIGLTAAGLVMNCTCPFGATGKGKQLLCKHRRALLERDFSRLSADRSEVQRLKAWLDLYPTEIAALLHVTGCAATPLEIGQQGKGRRSKRNLGVAACIDIETTGLAPRTDAVVEVAVALFTYDRTSAEILGIHEIYSSLEQPRVPISSAASAVSSISNELCAGKSIDWDSVRRMITQADLLVAHNAEFERRFLSPIPGLIDGKLLLCTQHIPKWADSGTKPSRRLEDLSARYGVPHLAHRAFGDVIATINLLALNSPSTGAPYFREILARAGQGTLTLSPKHN